MGLGVYLGIIVFPDGMIDDFLSGAWCIIFFAQIKGKDRIWEKEGVAI